MNPTPTQIGARTSLRDLLRDTTGPVVLSGPMPHLDQVRDDELRAAQDAVEGSLSSLRTGIALLGRSQGPLDGRDALALEKEFLALQMRVVDVMELARIRLDDGAVHLQPVMLDQAVRAVVEDGAAALAVHGLALDFQLQADVAITSDPRRLREIALRFLDLGVRGVGTEGRLSLRVTTQAGRALLEVESPGLGGAAQDSVGLRVCRTLAATLGARLAWTAPQRLQVSLPLRETRRRMPEGVADLRFL